jgi:predicted O-methyltransferase YrrM
MSADLNLDIGWRITEKGFAKIVEHLKRANCRSMIEFGSGASTVRWVMAMPSLRVISVEHDPKYLSDTKQIIEECALSDSIELWHRPLRHTWIGGRRFLTYSQPHFEHEVDCLIIDGPPGATRRGREACLYFAYDVLKIGGLVVLDDAARAAECRIIGNWMSVYPNSFELSLTQEGSGIAFLRKVRHEKPQLSLGAFCDNYGAVAKEILSR